MKFFEEINNSTINGVALKNLQTKRSILSYFAKQGKSTIADLSKVFGLSSPKVNSVLAELIEDDMVREFGKLGTHGGRRPTSYGLKSNSCFFIGVAVKQNNVNLVISDFQCEILKTELNYPYKLKNEMSSLEELCQIIEDFIKQSKVPKVKILGLCLNLTGRVNHKTGYSYSFFNFQEEPLSSVLKNRLGLNVYLENDSRAMAYGEFNFGLVNEEKNVLFVNLDHGIGLGIMIEGNIYYGKSGFAGEFGHIPIYNNEIICHCGKKGCLETEASGWALVRKFKERVAEGSSTILLDKIKEVSLEDILTAAKNDDNLAIEIIGEVGTHLGRGIALLINLYNPELIILGGQIAQAGDYLKLPLKMAWNQYSLSVVNAGTQLKISELGEMSGLFGACLIVRNKILEIE